jgi:flagellar motor switch protein FliN/FliY
MSESQDTTVEQETTVEDEAEEGQFEDMSQDQPGVAEAEPFDISGVEEALQAWSEGGHAIDDFDDPDEIKTIQFPQLDTTVVPRTTEKVGRLNNVIVDIAVELGTKEMTVRELTDLKEQDVIELDKLAGEAFNIRVNGRQFAEGEVVVVTDLMAVRITRLHDFPEDEAAGN